jgi:hypothetical protein
MSYRRHPNFQLQKLTIGRELAPLAVIDNVIANPEDLIEMAATKSYGSVASFYPGVRAKAPLTYQQFVLTELRELFSGYFGVPSKPARITSCHFSLVTTPANQLADLQTIPHIDSFESNELAFIHYLFKRDLGGTAFYRHRATGFEYLDQARRAEYLRHNEIELKAPNKPNGYINGDTPQYEQVGRQDGVFNRMLVYRRNSLHSGALRPDFVADKNPRAGRLSINGFIA